MSISITGLSSGLDTIEIVNQLMSLERQPQKNLETKKTNLQSEQTVFRNINAAFRSLETSLNNLRYSADWNKLKATSDSQVVTVSSNNSVSASEYTIQVEKLATKNVVEIDAGYILNKVKEAKDSNGLDLLKIGGYTFTQEDLDAITDAGSEELKLQKLANIINANTSLETNSSNATASVMKTTSAGAFKLILNSKETGVSNTVNFTLSNTSILTDVTKVTNKIGQDAKLVVNGVAVTRNSNTFDDLVEGVTFTLKSEGSSNISITKDTVNIVNNVKSFVAAYNNLISQVKNNLAKPADDSKMNPLQGDSLLRQIDTELYRIFNSAVKNTGDQYGSFMEQFGLSIDKGVRSGSQMTGKITFDETVFKNALAEDPDKVIGVFTNLKPTDGKTHTEGVVSQLISSVTKFSSSASGLLSNKVAGYDSEIKFVNDRMEQMNIRLDKIEARLKLQFSTMETMLSSLKSQQSWLSSQISSLSSSSS